MDYYVALRKGWPLIIAPSEVPFCRPDEVVGVYETGEEAVEVYDELARRARARLTPLN